MHHTHTVTGMMISAILFVIFLAGAYSLFRTEIQEWENPAARTAVQHNINYDRVVRNIDNSYDLEPHKPLRIFPVRAGHPEIEVYGETHEEGGGHDHFHTHINPQNYRAQGEEPEHETVVSQTLFKLHYLDQIPTLGLYISGFVALFFLLASISGILIHWRNIVQKFYAFFVGKRWKQIWTDAHTVIGVISLPFQVMYALSGALFGLSLLLLLPSVMVMFGGDQTPVLSTIRPELGLEISEQAPRAEMISLNRLQEKVTSDYPNHQIEEVAISHYGYDDAVATFYIDDKTGLMGSGSLSLQLTDGQVMEDLSRFPYQKGYSGSVYDLLVKLHFASFGGMLLKVIYFLLALLSCFMIISGVLIWQVARDKRQYSDKQKRFHHRVTKLNLTACLSLFPAIALLFIANKAVPIDYDGRGVLVKQIFFLSWVVLAAVGWKWDSYADITKKYFLTGSVLSFVIPGLNGLVTGDWFWLCWDMMAGVATIDLLWLLTGIVALFAVSQISIKKEEAEDKGSISEKVAEPAI
ncbi:PepSY-associated TM helix domain-containing protein [Fodinibius halophilus]|uniref:PepSY domain-containing protein n=1 Tax=Fodinibius halophilus TaxID=1736908 RepID=A0A6M1T7C9_9BACT|nr:PepSY-associated TM helix domain-containing protein [Fodinibius halophilus]NGP90107.1 hypothetical protein [Fodinibius halophilus]